MDFLDNLVLPQSAHHMLLLKYLLVLTYILLIPYLSILFGSLVLSVYYEKKAAKTSDKKYYQFAKELIDQITFNKGGAFALGVVPMISAAFCYAQLLHLTNLIVPEFILVAVLIFLIALILIYTYKYTFHLKDIFSLVSGQSKTQDELNEEVESYATKTSRLHKHSGSYGLTLLIIAVYFFIGAVQLAGDKNAWETSNDFFGIVISIKSLFYFIQFIIASLAITAALILYKYFRPNTDVKNKSEDYLNFVKNFSLKLGIISTIILPLFVVINIIIKPQDSFSYDVFGYALVALICLLVIAVLYYVMIKESNVRFSSIVIYLLVLVFAFIIIKDQYAFDTTTKKQFVMLAANYEEYQQKVKEEFGLVVETINGADIYNGKCIACHQFDRRLVGPPYNETLPKYKGNKDALVKFILNPVKINPEYPAMPNQGLKPKEAEAVADYLLSTYKK